MSAAIDLTAESPAVSPRAAVKGDAAPAAGLTPAAAAAMAVIAAMGGGNKRKLPASFGAPAPPAPAHPGFPSTAGGGRHVMAGSAKDIPHAPGVGSASAPAVDGGVTAVDGPADAESAAALRGVLAGLELMGDAGDEVDLPPGLLSVALLRHQRMALAWMQRRERSPLAPGGILADEQGLGKTLSTLALVLLERRGAQDGGVGSAVPRVHATAPAAGVAPGTPGVNLTGDGGGMRENSGGDDPVKRAAEAEAAAEAAAEAGAARARAVSARLTGGPGSSAAGGPRGIGRCASSDPARAPVAGGTLVVCPTSVLRQWEREIGCKCAPGAPVTTLVYHGPGRSRSAATLARYDIVLTTYAIVGMEVPRAADTSEDGGATPPGGEGCGDDVGGGDVGCDAAGPLAKVIWYRVVLDEAQSIKNPKTVGARACWALLASRRWCLTGTPVQNGVDDLFSYFRFLRFAPYDRYPFFRSFVKEACLRTPDKGFERLRAILLSVMLRRTKATKLAGEPIVRLPPRTVSLARGTFSPPERAFYTALERDFAARFQAMAAAGTVAANYVNILWMLLRLRQACNHPALVKVPTAPTAAPATGAVVTAITSQDLAAARKLSPATRALLMAAVSPAGGGGALCVYCADVAESATVATCGCVSCRQCVLAAVGGDDGTTQCPGCATPLSVGDVHTPRALWAAATAAGEPLPLVTPPEDTATTTATSSTTAPAVWGTSCKIEAVLAALHAIRGTVPYATTGAAQGPRPGAAAAAAVAAAATIPIPGSRGATGGRGRGRGATGVPTVSPGRLAGGRSGASAVVGVRRSSDAALVRALSPLPPPPAMPSSGGSPGAHCREKAIVFSQWTAMLDLLEGPLTRHGFSYRRLDGTMSSAQREKALFEFGSMPGVTVMLMSLKAAALGLNMTAANHVLLLDVWWNPHVEAQAIDRCHRIGQRRPVSVTRFTVEGSVEDKILALQERKQVTSARALGDDQAGGAAEDTGPRLSMTDLSYLFNQS